MAVPSDVRAFVDALDPSARGIRIGGVTRGASDGGTFGVVDPRNGEEFVRVASGTLDDAEAAVDAAVASFAAWRTTAPRARSEMLRRAFEIMIDEREVLAALITWENGKTLSDARAEVAYAAEFFRWFAEEAVRTDGAYGESPDGSSRLIVTHQPVGVAALVTPWNFPAAMATRKLAPALAAGCTTVLKPASETPLTALAIAAILERAGVPAGVVNVVPSRMSGAVVSHWLSDKRVRKISFTGSTEVGRLLLGQAAERVVNASMELGGNAPFIVADDADLDAAVSGALIAKLRNGGQACTAANRFFVHESIVDEFVEKLRSEFDHLVVGDPFDPATDIGPLVNLKAVDSVRSLVADAISQGAQVAYQSQGDDSGSGFFLAPMVIQGLEASSGLMTTEVFGPIAAIATWNNDDEVVAMANNSEFGLASYIYSRDLKRALTIAEALDAGMVGINRGAISDPAAPFGGVKQSGLGREGAREGLHEFLETKYMSVYWG